MDSGGSLLRSTEPNIGRLSWDKLIQSTSLNRLFITTLLILSPSLYALIFPTVLFSSDLQTISPMRATYSSQLILPDLIQNFSKLHRRYGVVWKARWILNSYMKGIITKQVRKKCIVARVCEFIKCWLGSH
jgi:hypothetical protein